MTLQSIGKIICEARKSAGYTQRTLADALFVTDKAVSKWERGICLPDLSLFSKISKLLDVDLEQLVVGDEDYIAHEWVGEIRVDDLRGTIAGKPLVHYLLAYFMLAGIRDVAILTKDREYINALDLEQYGLRISFFSFRSDRKMIVYDKAMIFGVNLTRHLQNCMTCEHSIFLSLEDLQIPILFARGDSDDLNAVLKLAERKNLPRGTVYIPMNTSQDKKNADVFVTIYEKYQGRKISDLNEIGRLRGLI